MVCQICTEKEKLLGAICSIKSVLPGFAYRFFFEDLSDQTALLCIVSADLLHPIFFGAAFWSYFAAYSSYNLSASGSSSTLSSDLILVEKSFSFLASSSLLLP